MFKATCVKKKDVAKYKTMCQNPQISVRVTGIDARLQTHWNKLYKEENFCLTTL